MKELRISTRIKIPCKPLYRFDQHCIHPQVQSIVELVQGEELHVLVNNARGPAAVYAVPAIFTSQSWKLHFKQVSKKQM